MKVAPTGIAPTPSNYRESAGVLLFWRELVLLCKRATHDLAGNTPAYPGYWAPFAGALEEGENPLCAARRELEEESGLSLPLQRLRYINPITSPDSIFHLYAVELEAYFSPTLDSEHEEYGYFKISALNFSPDPICPSIVSSIERYNSTRFQFP